MGLENGIILEMNTKIKYQPWFCNLDLDEYNDEKNYYEYIVDFWCSRYDLRRKIFGVLGVDLEDIQGEYSLDSNNVIHIIQLLKDEIMNNGDYQDKVVFWHTINNLYWVYEYMIKRPQDIIRCYFYDSY